ncbi:unnamed protein product [Paramecium octaurelia]|uniref:Uncharacterized protein n=1 Tax=Paramecium octaurelia TaxID=43137 RepID=A0A8S1VQF8_PAROT|nr:unnamed protein product [Paramecium octaurelia]
MDNTRLKRDQFRLTLHSQQRLNQFQENRKRFLQIFMEEQQINELKLKVKVAIQQLNDNLNDFDFDAPKCELNLYTSQIMQILPEMKKCIENLAKPDLEGLSNKFWNIYCFMLFNKDNPCFVEMLELLTLCCQKSMVFCDTYCKSTLYSNLQTNAIQFPIQYQLEFLKQTVLIQSHQEHQLQYDKLCEMIKQMIGQLQSQKVLEHQHKQIIQIIIEIFLTLKMDQVHKVSLQYQINRYFLTLFTSLSILDEILIGNELLNYIEYLNRNQSLFNVSTIELINQLSFNSQLSSYPDEKSMAIAIIGVLMSGNLTQSKYYFNKFSTENLSLDQKLLQNLKLQQSQVRKMTVFAFSNIFGETSYDRVDYFSNGTVIQFLQYARQENEIEVILEILQALRNLVYHAEDNYLPILLEQDIVSIIVDNENYILNVQQVECLLMLISRFEEYDQQALQNLVQFPNFIQYLCYKGVANFVRRVFDNSKFGNTMEKQQGRKINDVQKDEYQINLLKLCEIFC